MEEGREGRKTPRSTLFRTSGIRGVCSPERTGPKRCPLRPDSLVSFGGDEGDRTPDLGVANAALSQLSHIPIQGQLYLVASGLSRSESTSKRVGTRLYAPARPCTGLPVHGCLRALTCSFTACEGIPVRRRAGCGSHGKEFSRFQYGWTAEPRDTTLRAT